MIKRRRFGIPHRNYKGNHNLVADIRSKYFKMKNDEWTDNKKIHEKL